MLMVKKVVMVVMMTTTAILMRVMMNDDIWYSIEQHLKGVHKSAEGAVIGMECRKAKREKRQDLQLTFG